MSKRRFREPINRDDYWMAMAFMLAAGSNSASQQGCVIVGSDNAPLGMGHDGPLRGTQDSEHVIHAEMTALFGCASWDSGGVAYVTHTPCYHCVLNLLGANIKRIIYFPTETIDPHALDAARCAYGQIEEFKGNLNCIRDYIRTLDIF